MKPKTIQWIKNKYVVILLFTILLLVLRLIWHSAQSTHDQPHAVRGVLDMRGWDFVASGSITLDGEWEFYPNQYISSDGSDPSPPMESPTIVHVPGDWSGAFDAGNSSSYGYGTYRLRILIDRPLDQPYGFWFKKIQAASRVIINGQREGQFGVLAEQADQYKPKSGSYTASYIAGNAKEIELLVQVANFDYPTKGGIVQSIKFGSQAAIDTVRMYSVGFQLFTFVIMLLHSLYAVILFALNRRNKEFLVFALLLLSVGISIVSDHDSLLLLWLPINYTWAIKTRLLSYMFLSLFTLILTRSFKENDKGKRLFFAYAASLGLYSAFLIVSPASVFLHLYMIFIILYVIPVAWAICLIIKMLVKNRPDAVFLMLAVISAASSVIWGILQAKMIVSGIYYPVDIILAIVCFASYWFKRYFRNAAHNAELTEQLKLADKLKDVFLANTSHELRTPLHGIMNIAQTVITNEKQVMNDKSVKDMELLITVSRRMSHLLNDLMEVTRLHDKRIVLNPDRHYIQSAVSGVINMLEFMTKGKPLRIRMEIRGAFPPVYADEKRLVQILFNLLHNAIKFTDAGTITISAEVVDKMAAIHIADTGIGMDAKTQARALRPYEQGAHGTSDGGGIGLGLSICKELVELHGGQLTMESEPGVGSVFTFTLPLFNGSASLPEDTPTFHRDVESVSDLTGSDTATVTPLLSALQNTKKELSASADVIHILAVDDDAVNLKVLGSILSEEKYQIVPALSGKEALELLNTRQWDLVIADVMMPRMSGYELTRMIRERFSISELPILLLTARSQPEDVYTGFLSGANDYVAKPVDAMELKYRVWSLTKLKQSVQESLRMEGAYLQAQIQPHFLFNTLNSIMTLSDIDLDKMRGLGDAFMSYLRISFDFQNSERLVPLAHELELVRSYLYIEKVRFEDRLTIVWETDPDVDPLIPPVTIQPLVENAVKHGLLSRAKGGTLLIRIARIDGGTVFEVKDNGRGMDEEQVRLLLDISRKGKGGIGLLNTDRRLKQLFGDGLTIISKPGEGTTVSFVIPEGKQDDKNTASSFISA